MNKTLSAYAFSTTACNSKPDILNGKSINDFLKEKFDKGCISGQENLKKYGVYRILGWEFNFRPYLKRFIVKQYDQWSECYAPNKTALRKCTNGKIQEIYEITERIKS